MGSKEKSAICYAGGKIRCIQIAAWASHGEEEMWLCGGAKKFGIRGNFTSAGAGREFGQREPENKKKQATVEPVDAKPGGLAGNCGGKIKKPIGEGKDDRRPSLLGGRKEALISGGVIRG